jgi:hypothetical protein
MARLLLGLAFVALSFFGASMLLHNLGYTREAFGVGIGVGLLAAALTVFIEFLRRR